MVKRRWIIGVELLVGAVLLGAPHYAIAQSEAFEQSPHSSPLIEAINDSKVGGEFHRSRIVQLIDTGADVNARDHDGNTPLMLAVTPDLRIGCIPPAWYSDRLSIAELTEILLKAGADPNAQNRYGQSALSLASRRHLMFALTGIGESDLRFSNVERYGPVVALLKRYSRTREETDFRIAAQFCADDWLLATHIHNLLMSQSIIHRFRNYGITSTLEVGFADALRARQLLLEDATYRHYQLILFDEEGERLKWMWLPQWGESIWGKPLWFGKLYDEVMKDPRITDFPELHAVMRSPRIAKASMQLEIVKQVTYIRKSYLSSFVRGGSPEAVGYEVEVRLAKKQDGRDKVMTFQVWDGGKSVRYLYTAARDAW